VFSASKQRSIAELTHTFDPNQLQPGAESRLLIVVPVLRITIPAIAAATTSARPTA